MKIVVSFQANLRRAGPLGSANSFQRVYFGVTADGEPVLMILPLSGDGLALPATALSELQEVSSPPQLTVTLQPRLPEGGAGEPFSPTFDLLLTSNSHALAKQVVEHFRAYWAKVADSGPISKLCSPKFNHRRIAQVNEAADVLLRMLSSTAVHPEARGTLSRNAFIRVQLSDFMTSFGLHL